MSADNFDKNEKDGNLLTRLEQLERKVDALARRNIQTDRLSNISSEVGEIKTFAGTRIDGMLVSKRLNIIDHFGGFVGDPISLPVNAFSEDNIVHLLFTGRYFQETGSNKTLSPQIYLGPTGDEVPVSSSVTLSAASASVQRGFSYDVKITRAPNLGNYVLVVEKFSIEISGSPQTIERTTISQVTYATTLDEINSLILYMSSTGTSTTFAFYYDTLNVWIEEDLRDDDQLIWWSQPIGSESYDTVMQSGTASTNYSTNAAIPIGEPDSTTGNVRRVLIKFNDLSNLASIIDQYDIVSAKLFLRIFADNSSNARTLRFWRLLRDWDLATSTWNNYSTGNAWGTGGAGNNTTDYDGSAEVGSVSMAASEPLNTIKSITLDPDIIRGMIDGTYNNYGFLGKMDSESNDDYNFYSGNAATPSNAPILYLILQRR